MTNLLLEFRSFLIEMDTTPQEKENLRTIIRALLTNDRGWLNEKEILWGDKGPYWILNYRPGGRNEYNRLVRGLVVRKPDRGFMGDELELITSFPFTRFFNQHEKEADHVDLANADMLEKMDGTMVGVFFPTRNSNDPHWQTRKMLSTHQPDMDMLIQGFHGGDGYKFMPLIGEFVRKLDFTEQDVEFTYVFEFIHDASLVLTKYTKDQYGLYLIGGRHVPTHLELGEDQLDHVAARINSNRPRRWDAVASEEEIRSMMRKMAEDLPDFEGYVFRDRKTGKRIKVKDQEYLKKHRLISSLSIKNLIPAYLEKETDEILAYFPHAKDKLDLIHQRFTDYVDDATATVLGWIGRAQREHWNRKILAVNVMGPKDQGGVGNKLVSAMIMRMWDKDPSYQDVKDAVETVLTEIGLGKGKNAGSPKRLAEILGFGEEAEEEFDTEL